MLSEGLQWARISTFKLTHTVCKSLRGRATLLCILPPGALPGFHSEEGRKFSLCFRQEGDKSSCFERCPEHSRDILISKPWALGDPFICSGWKWRVAAERAGRWRETGTLAATWECVVPRGLQPARLGWAHHPVHACFPPDWRVPLRLHIPSSKLHFPLLGPFPGRFNLIPSG